MMAVDPAEPAPGAPAAPRTSRWSIAAILCSSAIFCPPLALVGPLLGVYALIDIRRRPHLKGRRLAVAGMVIGLLVTAGWIRGAWWWDRNARAPMLTGPRTAFAAGFAGDLKGFKAEFIGDAATARDAEVATFIVKLRRRYGEFIDCASDEEGQVDGSALDQAGVSIPYTLRFERAEVEARAVFHVWAEDEPGLVLKFSSVVVLDPEEGDLAYPQE